MSFRVLLIALFSFVFVQTTTLPLQAQNGAADQIQNLISQQSIEFDIYFLAADEFLGRDTGTNELDIASRYVATTFQTLGVQMAPGHDSYFQNVPFERLPAAEVAQFTFADSVYSLREHMIPLNSVRDDISAPVIFLEHATEAEIEEHGVEGKIVVANAGLPGQTAPQQFFAAAPEKLEWVKEAGGVALVELYSNMQFPWQILVDFLGGDRLVLRDTLEGVDDQLPEETGTEIPHLWLDATHNHAEEHFSSKERESGILTLTGPEPEKFYSRNVIGVIEGSDPDLKDEYILLSAHYDHTGVVNNHPEPITSEYIYNGARDNAVGTSGVLSAARYFAKNPPRRSVLLAAWTAEEIGLLGSGYFAENPMVPLEQIVFNLNIDGAGYNDTTKVTVIGLGRTEADDEMISAASAFDLEAIPDPVPDQNLFDRSDNVHFARQGIPAPTYSMGLTAFDDEINYYYHQVTDEPDTIDYGYVTSYIHSFVKAALLIADRDEAPFWVPGDVYEEAGRELYGIEVSN